MEIGWRSDGDRMEIGQERAGKESWVGGLPLAHVLAALHLRFSFSPPLLRSSSPSSHHHHGSLCAVPYYATCMKWTIWRTKSWYASTPSGQKLAWHSVSEKGSTRSFKIRHACNRDMNVRRNVEDRSVVDPSDAALRVLTTRCCPCAEGTLVAFRGEVDRYTRRGNCCKRALRGWPRRTFGSGL